jgi:hypothetical protein
MACSKAAVGDSGATRLLSKQALNTMRQQFSSMPSAAMQRELLAAVGS